MDSKAEVLTWKQKKFTLVKRIYSILIFLSTTAVSSYINFLFLLMGDKNR